jgi:hypothetical protein
MRDNILYLLNHKTLTDFEVPILLDKGLGIFITKKYNSLSKTNSIQYNSINLYDSSLKNISEDHFKYLSEIDFFNYKEINNNEKLMDILNLNFKAIFITLLSYESINYLSKNFNGMIYFRFFGLGGDNSYYNILKVLGVLPESLGNNVKYVFSYKEIFDFEKTQNNFFNEENSFYIPLGLPDIIFQKYENIHKRSMNKFAFVCSKIGFCSYYTDIYNKFNNLLDKNIFDFIIFGKDNEKYETIDNRIKNNLNDDDYYKNISNSMAMYYHSKEPRHLHYHPLEAIIIGLPLIFHSESLLSSYLNDSPGKCYSDEEVLEKLTRIKNGDYDFINTIIEYQNHTKKYLKIENNLNIFDNLINDIKKNNTITTKPALGIGDIFIEKFKSNSNNIEVNKIILTKSILQSHRKYPDRALQNLINLIKLLFDSCEIIIDDESNINTLQHLDIDKFPIKTTYIYDLIEYKLPKIDITYENYILIHTKVRIYPLVKDFIEIDLPLLKNFFSNFKTDKTIILCGEKYVEDNFEKSAINIFTIYHELLMLKKNNNVIDLSYQELYSGQENFEDFLYDVELINKAECNINFGIGGQLSLVYAFSKKPVTYLNNIVDHLKLQFGQNYNVLKSYNNISKLYSNIHDFINKIDDEYSIVPRNYLTQYRTDKNAYFVGHNGLGDNITNFSAVNYLSNFYSKIFFICKIRYYNNVKLLLNDITNIEVIPIDETDEFNNIKKIYDEVINSNDFFVSGFCHTHYIKSKITNEYLTNFINNKDIHIPETLLHIKDFYEVINLDLSIYYGFFNTPSLQKSKDLYNSIKHYEICLTQMRAQYSKLIDFENVLFEKDNNIIIDINENFYEKTREINPIKYKLAQQFVNIELVYYIDTILNCDKIFITDSCLSCFVYPLFKLNKLATDDITIIDRHISEKVNI